MAGEKLFNIWPEEEFQPRIARIITDKKPKGEGLGAFSSAPILKRLDFRLILRSPSVQIR